ncbi:MAG: DNA mismatch endonuclease Vsr [Alphaproteobacteria bacterium]|nr:DNA mismatch endonuclease Vsr [Alphaproteobacteria bacterium]
MRAVKSRDTTPELRVRAACRALGLRYRLDYARWPGRPDLAFPGRRRAIFVHGCFWHGHDCARGARAPKTNAAYWAAKIARNQARDARTLEDLSAHGISALVLWECEVRDEAALADRLRSFFA